MLAGSVAGGFIAAQWSLGVPFVLRGVVLVVMFAVAFRVMRDIGFTPEQGGRPLAEMRRIAAASIDYGWRVPAVKWLMVESLFTGGVGIYVFYALQPYLLELWGDPRGVPDRRPRGGDRRRRADPRRARGAVDPAPLPPAHLRADRDRGAQLAHARPDRPRRELLGACSR